jgi:hypothetical protein
LLAVAQRGVKDFDAPDIGHDGDFLDGWCDFRSDKLPACRMFVQAAAS